jgi:pilus assembly protein CpaE
MAAAPEVDVQLNDQYPTDGEIEACDQAGLAAVIVALTSGPDGIRAIRGFRTAAPEVPIVGVGQTESADSLLEAMRAGASDFLWPPFSREKLANLLQTLPSGLGRKGPGQTICFAPCQATDGASTIALHVAHALPELTGKTPLLIDCDIHSSTLAFRLGTKFDFHVGDALERINDIDTLWKRVATEWKGFRLLACPTHGQPPTEALRRRLPDVVASATHAYQTVIADLPSSLSPTIAEIARRADRLYLVCTPHLVSLHLARRRLDQMKALGVDLANVRLLVNRFDSQNAVSSSTIEDALGMPVDFSLPNEFEGVNQAAMKGGLVAPNTPLAQSLEKLTRHIFGVVPAQKEKASSWKRLLHMG